MSDHFAGPARDDGPQVHAASEDDAVRPNVLVFMVDTLRRVSEHVTIGSAARKGKDMGSWFALCREA